jgi:hypothetical protein
MVTKSTYFILDGPRFFQLVIEAVANETARARAASLTQIGTYNEHVALIVRGNRLPINKSRPPFGLALACPSRQPHAVAGNADSASVRLPSPAAPPAISGLRSGFAHG